MDVKDAIEARRAYRALGPVNISDELISELASAARLAPSCFNNQPWRFVFVRSPEALARVQSGLGKNNDWARRASLVIAAFAKRENDCLIKGREYYLFDLGMAVSALQLRATELGLVAHPIAGFDPDQVRSALAIPDGYNLITLINVGKKSSDDSLLTEHQRRQESSRPDRLPPENIYSIDAYDPRLEIKPEH